MRTFVLFHEWGHIALRDAQVRVMESKDLDMIINVAKEISSDPNRLQHVHKYFRKDSSADKIFDLILGQFQRDELLEELLADIFAIKYVIHAELIADNTRHKGSSPERTALVFRLVYEAIMLLYYITATMNSTQELFKPKAIRNEFELKQFQSVSALVGRADARGKIWQIMLAQHFNNDLKYLQLVQYIKIGLCERYLITQLNAATKFQLAFKRQKFLRDVDESRLIIDEAKARLDAKREYGFLD
jgi:hypothetical protein